VSNQEILEKAIQKAIDGGWKGSPYLDYMKLAGEQWKSDMVMGEGIWLVAIVYSPPHDFAKALWGEVADLKDVQYTLELGEGEVTTPIYRLSMPLWKWHLQNMVIADNPIAYLGENI